MRLATVTDLDTQSDLGNYKARPTVVATPCEDGVTVTDAAGAGVASFTGRCYLVVNQVDAKDIGDRFAIIPADVFEAIYAFDSEVQQPEQASGDPAVTKAPQVTHNDDGSVTIDGVTYNQS